MFYQIALIFCLFYLSSGSLQVNQNIERALAELTVEKLPVSLKNDLSSKDDK